MPDEVVIGGEGESQDASEAEATDASATPVIDETTWKKRLAGKDQALTAKQKEAEALKEQNAAYQRKIAEYENASMSELDKLKKELAEAQAAKAAAEASALRVGLEAKYPLIFALLGDKAPLDDEAWLAERNALLSKDAGESDEPIVDRNNPRRPSPATKPENPSAADLEKQLAAMGNPFKGLGFGG